MKISALVVASVLGLTLMTGCKKGEEGAPGAAKSDGKPLIAKPLITKPLDQVTKDDLEAAITGLGWKPGQSSNSASGALSNIMVTAQKDGDKRQLTVAVFKMPADRAARWPADNAAYASEVQGTTILGVKYFPADPAEATKTAARLMGK